MGRPTLSQLRAFLQEDLSRAVRQSGVVIWQDDQAEYATVAESVFPQGATSAKFNGSWYELRRQVEESLAGEEPPQLIIYTGAPPPKSDPLAEIRACGFEYKRRLRTLVRNALDGRVAESRVEEIARDARTFEEAEAAAGGSDDADVRLVGLLGASDNVEMATRIIDGGADGGIQAAGAWEEVRAMLGQAFGGDLVGEADELRASLARQICLADIASYAGDLPDALASSWEVPTAQQQSRINRLLDGWRYLPGMRASYRDHAATVDRDLDLAAALDWTDGLAACASTPVVEGLAFKEALSRLNDGDPESAAALAQERLLEGNPWRDEKVDMGEGRWGDKWRAVDAIAQVRLAIARNPIRPGAVGALVNSYTETAWEVDRAHRKLELAAGVLAAHGALESEIARSRKAYEGWLDGLLRNFTSSLAATGLSGADVLTQGEVHDRFIKGSTAPVAYVWVDALRYELAAELAEGIRVDISTKVDLQPAISSAPTITRVGMASLLPSAAEELSLRSENGQLQVEVGDRPTSTVEQRVELLRAAHGSVANLDLGALNQLGDKELSRAIEDADLVLVRSQEVDAAGESGMLSWSWFEATKQDLANAIAKLGQAGIGRVVVTADHGFLVLSQAVQGDRTIDGPIGGDGELHRRYWVGKGGTTSESTIRVPLVSLGMRSDLDMIVPAGLAVFRAAGGKQFFHGGLSPQEMVVPVIVVDLEPAQEPQNLDLQVTIAGGRITTGVFAATIEFHGDLFTNEVTFRVVARGGSESDPVARVLSGDGFDPDSGSVTVRADEPTVLTFQVTSNLDPTMNVEVQVLDARTGRRLAGAIASVAAPVIVDDDL